MPVFTITYTTPAGHIAQSQITSMESSEHWVREAAMGQLGIDSDQFLTFELAEYESHRFTARGWGAMGCDTQAIACRWGNGPWKFEYCSFGEWRTVRASHSAWPKLKAMFDEQREEV